MPDLKGFRKDNGLTQSDLAEYLGGGVDKGFISQIEHGTRKLPNAQLAKLLNNTMGWDTSMLQVDPPTSISAKATGNSSARVEIGSRNKNYCPEVSGDTEKDTRIAVLEKENEMLRERLKDKDGQIEFLKTLIK